MIRIQVLATCASALLLLLACSARSQTPPPRGENDNSGKPRSEHVRSDESRHSDAREREAFFDAMLEFLPHKELFDLVEHDSVRREIKLSEADAELIEKNVSKSFETIHAIRKANEGKQISAEELKRQMHDGLEPLTKASYAILAKADLQRLLGLYVQARSYRALLNDQVAGQIGLEGEALERFRQSRSESWQAIMEDTREAIKRAIRNTPPGVRTPTDVFGKLFTQAEEKLDLKLSQKLTQAQREDLEALKGAKFDLPKHPFKYGPPSGRSRGRNGGRGPGDKGTESKSSSESESRDCKSDGNDSSESSRDRDNIIALPSSRR